MKEINYKGTCYWCETKEVNVHNKPVAGVRLCKDCLAQIGQWYLEAIELAKGRGVFANIKAGDAVLSVIRDIHNMESVLHNNGNKKGA